MPQPPKPSILWFLFFASIFSLQVVPRFLSDAPTADEPSELCNGYFYWQGDLLTNPQHPPLFRALAALPLRLFPGHPGPTTAASSPVNYEQRYQEFFFARHRDDFQVLFAEGRAVIWLFGLGIGFLLWRMARRQGHFFTWAVLTLWAFEPSLLAFSGLVYADVPFAFSYLLALFLFQRFLEKPDGLRGWVLGAALGVALTMKFSAVALLPLFLLLAGFSKGWEPRFPSWPWGPLARALIGAFLTIGLVYLPGTLVLPEHRLPWAYWAGGFLDLLSISTVPVYLMGGFTLGARWAYYPMVVLLKTPLSLLILAGLALLTKRKGETPGLPLHYWLPGAFFLLFMIPFQQLGVREILPLYPFLILTGAWGAKWLWERPKGRWGSLVAGGLLLFQAVSVASCYPGQLAYFNETIRPDRRLYWLGDSNLDLGQDTKRFAEFGKRKGWTHVKLVFLSVTDPALYGLKWEQWDAKDLKGPQPGWVYGVNAAYLQLAPAFQPAALQVTRGWIASRPPTGMVGDTWYYFEVPSVGSPVSR